MESNKIKKMKKIKDILKELNNEIDLADLVYLEAMEKIKPKKDNLKQMCLK